MKAKLLLSLICFTLWVFNSVCLAFTLVDNKSIKLESQTNCQLRDSGLAKQSLGALKWDIGLGITKSGPFGLSASTSLFFPVHKLISIKVSSGLVSFRGPAFAYHSETYFNDGISYNYIIEDNTIGDYLAHQFSIGFVLTEPEIKKLSFFLSSYHLRLIRSTSIKSNVETRSRQSGLDEFEVKDIELRQVAEK